MNEAAYRASEARLVVRRAPRAAFGRTDAPALRPHGADGVSGGGAGRPSPARADAILDAGRQPEAAGAWYLDMQRHTDTRKRDVAMIAGIVRDPEADA